MNFPTHYTDILERLSAIKPVAYGKNRNFIDGDVTYLSPYISRGVISTKQVYQSVKQLGYADSSIEKFVQELAWRDYWQQIWIVKGTAINQDLKRPQPRADHRELSQGIITAKTGIHAIDSAIEELYSTGYMHNHMRMYTAMLSCHVSVSHWHTPARWMYYHLFDGDWASNALSWQWVAGSNSNKTYIANQDNINKYTHSTQKGSYLDISYEALAHINCPSQLAAKTLPDLVTNLPIMAQPIKIDQLKPTLIYNYYNLDPIWQAELLANRVLLIEPEHFKSYPISEKCMDFMLELAKNIPNIQVYVGSFANLISEFNLDVNLIKFKEHPLNQHYQGQQEPRDWISSITGYYPSFFAFWKKVKKELSS